MAKTEIKEKIKTEEEIIKEKPESSKHKKNKKKKKINPIAGFEGKTIDLKVFEQKDSKEQSKEVEDTLKEIYKDNLKVNRKHIIKVIKLTLNPILASSQSSTLNNLFIISNFLCIFSLSSIPKGYSNTLNTPLFGCSLLTYTVSYPDTLNIPVSSNSSSDIASSPISKVILLVATLGASSLTTYILLAS